MGYHSDSKKRFTTDRVIFCFLIENININY